MLSCLFSAAPARAAAPASRPFSRPLFRPFVLAAVLLAGLAVALAGSAPAHAQPRQAIHPDKSGQALRDALRQDYNPEGARGTGTIGYDRARDDLYRYLDDQRGDVTGVYGGYSVAVPDNEDPSAYLDQEGINTEHTWPQSKGAGSEPEKSDLHNLFPTASGINSARGNRPFDEIPDSDTDTWYIQQSSQSTTPSSNVDAHSERDGAFPGSSTYDARFEPREDHEGNAARAVFYFRTVHQGAVSDADFFPEQEATLLDWHDRDPVDQDEYDRSQWIATKQGTNNPFVLDPTLADRAFAANGAGPTLTVRAASPSASEGESVALTVEINNTNGSAVDADLALAEGSSSAGPADFGSYQETVSFGAGAADGAKKSVSVPVTDDGLTEGPETGVFQLRNVQSSTTATVGAPSAAEVDVASSDGGPTPLFSENFESYSEGATAPGDGSWSIDVSDADLGASDDYFSVQGVSSNNVLEAQDTDGEVRWKTQSIDISGASSVGFTIDVREDGDLEDADYADVEYSTDGGSSFTTVTNWNGQGTDTHTLTGNWTSATVAKSGLSGSSLVLRVRADNNAGTENIRFDNVEVTSAPAEPTVRFVNQGSTVDEGAGTVSVGVKLVGASPASGNTVTAEPSLTGGSAGTADFAARPASVSFDAANSPGDTKSLSYTIEDDSESEGDEVAEIGLSVTSQTGTVGSPGTFDLEISDNDAPPLVINEVLADPPTGAAGDANGDGTRDSGDDEFVEIFNTTSSSIDLGGYELKDDTGVRHTFPDGTTLPANTAAVVFGGGTPTGIPGVVQTAGGLGLNNSGDTVTLLDDTGSSVASISYGSEGGDDQSLVRDPDFTGPLVKHTGATGADGAAFSPGTPLTAAPSVFFTTATRTVAEGNSGSNTVDLEVQLANPDPATATSVDVVVATSQASGGTDYTFNSPTTLTFPAGSSSPKTASVEVQGDTEAEGPETVTFELENVSGPSGADVAIPGQLVLTIEGDDAGALAAGDLVVSEVMQNPEGLSDSEGEYFEVYNTTDRNVDLSGLTVEDAGSDSFTGPSVVVADGHYAVFCRSQSAVSAACDHVYDGFTLANGGDEIILRNTNDTEIDRVAYDGGTNWPDPAGASMVFTGAAAGDNNDGANWQAASESRLFFAGSRSDAGSPGTQGPAQQLAGPPVTVSQTTAPEGGWRILAVPAAKTVQWLVDSGAHVQGLPGFFPGADPNVFVDYDPGSSDAFGSTGWVPATATGDALTRGDGFIWNPFSFDPATTFEVTAGRRTGSVDVAVPSGQTWGLLGNPFLNPLWINDLDLSGSGFSTTIQAWDPSAGGGAGSYVSLTKGTGSPTLAPLNGAWLEKSGGTASTLTLPSSAQAPGSGTQPFLRSAPSPTGGGEPAAASRSGASGSAGASAFAGASGPDYVSFTLTGEDESGDEVTYDQAATLLISDAAAAGDDARDATKRTPLTEPYATFAFEGPAGRREALRAVASYPRPASGRLEVPVRIVARGTEAAVDSFRIRWPDFEPPSGWSVGLVDRHTGRTVDLEARSAYAFAPEAASGGPAASADAAGARARARPRLGPPAPAAPRPAPLRTVGSPDPSSEDRKARAGAGQAKPGASAARFAVLLRQGALPVELATLRASSRDRKAVLRWTTASETGNAGFAVEHRREGDAGTAFETLGFVEGSGTTSEPQSYTFRTDALPLGTHVFRLRQVDADGAARTSRVVRATVEPQQPLVLTPPSPNPVRTRARLRLAVREAQSVRVALYDALGRRLRVLREARVEAGEAVTLSVPTGGLSSGLYFVRATGKGRTATRRLTVVR